ncbi:hypothetical protein [Streptomyces sp. NPDC058953]|uniref:hypothetical protein n=1 Tax=unclassified Streptomyces TaxID=2593676 RepID=UPI0036C44225
MSLHHPDGAYAITFMYSVPDEAWYLELDLVAGQRTLVTAIVPDEEPAREPTVCFDSGGPHHDIPYDVMKWFTGEVEKEIRTSRAWMRLRPELVEVVYRLRQEYLGMIGDDEFPGVLAEIRAEVPAVDLAAVLVSAFGRRPDGSAAERADYRDVLRKAVRRDAPVAPLGEEPGEEPRPEDTAPGVPRTVTGCAL